MPTARFRLALVPLLFFLASAAFATDPIILSAVGLCNGHTPINGLAWAPFVPPPYTVLRNNSSIATTNNVTFTDVTAVPGTLYTYVVTAQGGAVRSLGILTQTQVCNQLPTPPTLTLSELCNSSVTPNRSGVHLSWTAVAGVDHYEVFGAGGSFIASTTGTSQDDLSVLTPGRTYDYYVSAVKNLNGVANSNQVFITLSSNPCVPPAAFTLNGASACDTSPATPTPTVSLAWTASPYAASYQILRDGAAYATSSATAFTDGSVAPGQSYSYVVRATNPFGSIDSNAMPVAVPAAVCQIPPLSFTASSQSICTGAGEPQVNIQWTPAKFAGSYSIYRSGVRIIDGIQPAEHVRGDDQVVVGETYSYVVRASNTYGTAEAATVATVPASVCVPAPVSSLSLLTYCDHGAPLVHATWPPVRFATWYQIFRDGTAVSPLLIAPVLTYDDRTASAGKTYGYLIRSSNVYGASDSNVADVSIAGDLCPLPAQPFAIEAHTGCGLTATVTLDWIPPGNVTAYTIYRNGEILSGLPGIGGTFTDTKAVAGATYTYFVRGESAGATFESNSVLLTVAGCPVIPPRHRSARH